MFIGAGISAASAKFYAQTFSSKKKHEADAINLQESTGNILQQGSLLPPCFPKPMTLPPSVTCDAIHPNPQQHKIDPPANKHKSNYPKSPLYPPTGENIQKLKKKKNGCWINLPPPPAHIHLKEGSTPKAKHNPIPVLYHYKEEVRKALWENVKRVIITLVPTGTPPIGATP